MLRVLLASALLLPAAAPAPAPAPQRDAAERAADKGDKLICKRFLETGSLVRGYRVCKTKRDWERERDALRQSQGSGGCGGGDPGRCGQ
jgi:hypothetical protein